MSIQAVAWALEQSIPNAGLKLLLVAICNRADKETGDCYPSIRRLERDASMSRSTVKRHMNGLADLGLIEIMRGFDARGRQTANGFRVVFDPAEQKQIAETRRRQGGVQFEPGGEGQDEPIHMAAQPVDNLSSNRQGGVQSDPVEGSTVGPPGGFTAEPPKTNHHRNHQKEDGRARASLLPTFADLLKNWTAQRAEENLPDCHRAFERLSVEDQRRAIELASVYCKRAVSANTSPRVLRYLRDRGFEEMDGAPPFDRDGDFIITPDRPEWSPWLASVGATHGIPAAKRVEAQGIMLRKTRWPLGHVKAA